MNVAVKLNDGLVIHPSYDPEHKVGILEFYKERFLKKEIAAYKVSDNAGVVVASEGVF